MDVKRLMIRQRFFPRGHPRETRTHCACGLCRLRFGRMFVPKRYSLGHSSVVILSPGYNGRIATVPLTTKLPLS
jgi:hypothetical protein